MSKNKFVACISLLPWLFGVVAVFPTPLRSSSEETSRKGKSNLNSITKSFQTALQETAQPLFQLQDQYERKLKELQGKAEQSGNLKLALEIKGEIKDFRSGSLSDSLSELRRFQKVYRDGLRQKREQFRRSIKPHLVTYYQELNKLETDLTGSGQLDEAIKAQGKKNEIKDLLETKMFRVSIDLGILDEGNNPTVQAIVTIVPDGMEAKIEIGQLRKGSPIATNRSYSFTGIPKDYEGLQFLRMEARGNLKYTYEVTGKSILYALAMDDNFNASDVLEEDKWENTGHTVQASAGSFKLFQRIHKKGIYKMEGKGNWALMLVYKGKLSVRKSLAK